MANEVIVIGNWKMNKTAREAVDYIERLSKKIEGSSVHVWLAVPFTSIAPVAVSAQGTSILVGAQNMNDARDGAFTGEIATLMLKEAGAAFVILGHSERRKIFQESDEFIHRKVLRAIQDDVRPVLCVGETAIEREQEKTFEVLQRQISSALQEIPEDKADQLVLAYEPVWAIGSGRVATTDLVQQAHAYCRECLEEYFGKRKAKQVPIIYGGSVTPEHVQELIAHKDVSGVLVGGASLDVDVFSAIIHNCEGIK